MFFDQISVRPVDPASQFSRPGDSGAVLIMKRKGRHVLVGLMHGVTEGGKKSIACHFEDVQTQLGFDLAQ